MIAKYMLWGLAVGVGVFMAPAIVALATMIILGIFKAIMMVLEGIWKVFRG